MFKLVDICLNWMLITENLRLLYSSVSHSIYDIFQLGKIIFRQGGKINSIKISTFCLEKIKKVEIPKFASVAIHTEHCYLQFYFCAIDFDDFILQEEKNRTNF